MSLYYVDTSAAIKLLVEETHSKAFAGFYDAHPDADWISSDLLWIEVARAVASPIGPCAHRMRFTWPQRGYWARNSTRSSATPIACSVPPGRRAWPPFLRMTEFWYAPSAGV